MDDEEMALSVLPHIAGEFVLTTNRFMTQVSAKGWLIIRLFKPCYWDQLT